MREMLIISVGMALSFAVMGCGVWMSLHADRRIQARGCLVSAAGMAVQVITNMLVHNTLWACVSFVIMCAFLWVWWNNGGGDGMKRRLKAWADSLGRHMAPQAV